MCGITGIFAFNEAGRFHLINLQRSVDLLQHRGPDTQGTLIDDRVGLGHRRLSVIDTSPKANQPMKDPTGRYSLVYNGEIYNFREIRKILQDKYQVQFRSRSDTEVVLQAFIVYGERCLEMFNGDFALAIYDHFEKEMIIARDPYGVKPLYYFHDEDKFIFASELRSVMAFGIPRSICTNSLILYLQLNYIPAPFSILNGVYKLLPGHFIRIRKKEIRTTKYYDLDTGIRIAALTKSEDPVKTLIGKLENSVSARLVSDVPLGIFLSGGIDSSLITALAARHSDRIRTFSIGFHNAPFFDEKKYALEVAKYFKTDHHIFNISNDDLLQHLSGILDHFDEPFADSSAIPVYLLSKLTRSQVTVALSGDGADEVFSGYNKHRAFYLADKGGIGQELIRAGSLLWRLMPKSRNSYITNRIRQFDRHARGLKLNAADRYWFWAGFLSEQKALSWLSAEVRENYDPGEGESFRYGLTSHLGSSGSINDILRADMQLVLPNDMLYKVDMMSMAHGLEVRVPFLDRDIVEYAFSLPEDMKINKKMQKTILREALKKLLPGKLHQRPKHGFEVPLLKWFKKDLRRMIAHDLLGNQFIRDQGIFDPRSVGNVKKKLYSFSPDDTHAHIWALLVFQAWWKKYFS